MERCTAVLAVTMTSSRFISSSLAISDISPRTQRPGTVPNAHFPVVVLSWQPLTIRSKKLQTALGAQMFSKKIADQVLVRVKLRHWWANEIPP